ncbi:hypothetical protein L6452_13190 [Arctium lappa]|uniref:Uncharacterized protein n=1 Tax=Arctium lappa TaxID=4217 RepID=A0ACB9CHK3_ARCLA|nr:hypothetical protein L6452_13190 [Arctium lappa]
MFSYLIKEGESSGLGKGSAMVEGSRSSEVTQEHLDEFEPFSDEDEMDHSKYEDYDYIDEEDGITNDEDMMNFHLNTHIGM